jgi:hypothetical protein
MNNPRTIQVKINGEVKNVFISMAIGKSKTIYREVDTKAEHQFHSNDLHSLSIGAQLSRNGNIYEGVAQL